ncbi:hypothetical protein LTR35_009126 [Friedmanniomyces endolithicus]|nr:hypothetical protein LTR35_009126 [Friedmanniomyces endolithicus]KAK0285952.1 hypothetical protein LTS00_010743 [Friedmanniomyces endolithicus]KAK1016631.1 hypothetical protein LTR54_003310 [Friedmanniomyces endolithicus]
MPGGRTPKNDYDWDDKKDVCYQLFVVEKKSINEIITHFANHFGVAETELPRRQFTDKWHFPPRKEKRKPEDEAAIVERMRQLWEQNMLVAKMQEALDDEGWGVGLSEFQKLRRINGFTRRVNDGAHVGAPARKRKRGEAEVMEEPGDQAWTVAGSSAGATMSAYSKPGMSQGEATRRANRLAQIQFDSDNALLTRRRRRRIRNYGHLPPDAPNMAPRYNTETTPDECKASGRCSTASWTTTSSPRAWPAATSTGTSYDNSPLLQQVMAEGDPHKIRCVDVLCRDATKRRNDDYVRKGPNRKEPQQRVSGPGPGSARAPAAAKKREAVVTPTKPAPAVAKEPKKTPTKKVTKIHAKTSAANSALGTKAQPIDADRLDPALSAISNPYTAVEPLSIPVYFRLSPQSQIIGHHPRLWLGKLTARTVSAVHQAATSKAGAAQVTKVHGLIKNEDGSEDSYLIEGDEELDVYLGAAGEKASFLVVLERVYA